MGCVNADASGFVIRAAAGDDTPSGINAGVAKGLFRGVEVNPLEAVAYILNCRSEWTEYFIHGADCRYCR
jgi:hypothetical protein